MSVLLDDQTETVETPVDQIDRPKRGRPPKPKDPSPDAAEDGMPPETMPPLPSSVAPSPRYVRLFEHLDVGDMVHFFEKGDTALYPMVGLILAKYPKSRTFDLIIWCREHRASYGTREGVRHIDDPDANTFQINEVGSWRETRTTNMLMDLLESQ